MYQLEQPRPFANSLIWALQREFFAQAGIEAWRQGEVPHYLTSNPVVGRTYAEMVLAFLRDRALMGAREERVYLLELGAGHGRLCYHFFKHFERYYEAGGIELPPFTYVLSDVVSRNLAFFQDHPRLIPFIEAGWLDIAQFDAATGTDIHLENARCTITENSLAQPLIVVANYVFDTIPQDLFHICGGEVSHVDLSLSSELDPSDYSPAELIEALQLSYSTKPVHLPVYPENRYLNDLLKYYRDAMDETYLLLPHLALDCLDRLGRLSASGLLLLTADKGEHHLSNLDAQPPPGLATHGSFSLPVNYHAFRAWAEMRGGLALFPRHQQAHLDLGCLLVTPETARHVETRSAYERFVGDFGPDDYFALKKMIEPRFDALDFAKIMAVLRLSGYDARIFGQMQPRLMALAEELTRNQRDSLRLAVPRIWDTFFPLGEAHDLAADLGDLLAEIDCFAEALVYYEMSTTIYGREIETLIRIAGCHLMMGEKEDAARMIAEVRQRAPEESRLADLEDAIANYPV